jgi:hypothetical protein
MTEIHSTLDPSIEAEMSEHQAALIRQMVVTGIIVCIVLVLVGTASLIIDTARSVAGLLTAAFDSSIFAGAFR